MARADKSLNKGGADETSGASDEKTHTPNSPLKCHSAFNMPLRFHEVNPQKSKFVA